MAVPKFWGSCRCGRRGRKPGVGQQGGEWCWCSSCHCRGGGKPCVGQQVNSLFGVMPVVQEQRQCRAGWRKKKEAGALQAVFFLSYQRLWEEKATGRQRWVGASHFDPSHLSGARLESRHRVNDIAGCLPPTQPLQSHITGCPCSTTVSVCHLIGWWLSCAAKGLRQWVSPQKGQTNRQRARGPLAR